MNLRVRRGLLMENCGPTIFRGATLSIFVGSCIAAATFMTTSGKAADLRVPNRIPNLVVEWESQRFALDDAFSAVKLRSNEADQSLAHGRLIDCSFVDMKTRCWRLHTIKQREWSPYGTNLKFVEPIAALLEYHDPASENNSDDDLGPDWSEKAKKIDYVRALPNVQFDQLEPVKVLLSHMGDMLNYYSEPGSYSQAHIFAKATTAIGGLEALDLWKGLIGKMPTRDCYDEEDSCAIVLNAKRNGEDAIAYCMLLKTNIGYGYPFGCSTVAFVQGGDWYVYSYDSPEQCDGCGAASGASCTSETNMSLDNAASIFVQAMKSGKTNIDLVEVKRTSTSITYAAKKIAVDSKFYKGYYEDSSANYTLEVNTDGGQRTIMISGLFVMLISADPSPRPIDYREIGDIVWFQDQVLKMIKDNAATKIGKKAECENMGL